MLEPCWIQLFRNMEQCSLRPLLSNDVEQVVSWLMSSRIKPFWDTHLSQKELKSKFLNKSLNHSNNCFIMVVDSKSIGYLQWYSIEDNSIGIDLFIGEESYLHKGYATYFIKNIQLYIDAPYLKFIVVDPQENNLSAIKAFTRMGFKKKENKYILKL